MANLQSPGVSVSVIDQSQYVSTGASTIPFIVLATGSNKANASGTGVATGTLDTNANKLYQITSQRDLVNLFGIPKFHKSADGTPIHGHELNEYGLQAAYSVLGVTNLCYVLRSSIDTNALFGSLVRPSAPFANDSLWHNWVSSASYLTNGYRVYNGTTFITTGLNIVQYPDQLDLAGYPNYSAPVGTVVYNPFQTSEAPHAASSYFVRTSTEWVRLGSREWQKYIPTVRSVITPPVADTTFRMVYGYLDAAGGNVDVIDTTLPILANATATDYAATINGLGIVEISAVASGTSLLIYTSGSNKNTYIRIFATGFNSDIRYRTPQVYVGGTIPVTAIQNHMFPIGTVWMDVNSTNTTRLQYDLRKMVNGSWVKQSVVNYASEAAANAGNDKVFGGSNLQVGSLYLRTPNTAGATTSDYAASPLVLFRRRVTGPTIFTGTIVNPVVTIGQQLRVAATVARSAVDPVFYTLTIPTPGGAVGVANAINAHVELTKQLDASVVAGQLVIKHITGGAVYLDDNVGVNYASNGVITALGLRTATGAIRGGFLRQTFAALATTTSGAGTSATVTVRRDETSYFATISAGGTGYAVGDTITVSGVSLGGAVDNNLVLKVMAINAGAITRLATVSGTPIAPIYSVALSGWEQVSPEVNDFAPRVDPLNGTLWNYSAVNEVDIMTNVNGVWKGYRTVYYGEDGLPLLDETGNNAAAPVTDVNGPIIADSAPTVQSNGAPLQYGDLWVDSGELDAYPVIHRWQKNELGVDTWVLIDVTNQESSSGMVFADMRWSNFGSTHSIDDPLTTIAAMATSSYVDLDAPSAELYPHGILAFNMRRSGNNIKKYVVDYFNAIDYPNVTLPLHRNAWVTVSGKDAKGVGYFGRKAQRSAVVASLKSAIATNTSIREEDNFFNIIAAPGYPELQPDMVVLNNDRGNTAYIIGDTPFRLDDQATSLTAWATNANGATSTGEDGMVTRDEYMGVYYPSAISTDLNGDPIVVPASHAMIRTMIRSDSNSYQWFAPAGIQRGAIDNVTNIGYIDSASGEFITVKNRVEIRDVLYTNNINPFTFFNGIGIVNYGNKNSKDTASAMNRTNVSRLVAYLRDRVAVAVRPFVFQMNDEFTRSQVREVVNSLLIDIAAKRGITEYFVECSDKNNTPDVIDRNELIVDIGVVPNKSIEFIYVPIRIMNTGDI